jgi:hypothetical protein
MTWNENKKQIITKKGKVENKSPRHYDVSNKSLSMTLAQPLALVSSEFQVKTVEKGIKSRNPIDEIKNIRNRYQGKYAIFRESMQNSERIGRDRNVPIDIIITITPDKFKIEDNGGGMTKNNVDVLFNLGESGYENLDESSHPFGQGFMSFILLFNKVEIVSNDVNIEFDWSKIESEYDKNKKFDLSHAYTAQEASSKDAFNAKGKFIAIFTKPEEIYNSETAIANAFSLSKSLPVRSITINDKVANNKLDFSKVPNGYVKVYKSYNDKIGIEGYFAPSTSDDYLRLYFQGLPCGAVSGSSVDNRYKDLPSITGDVNINNTFYGDSLENRDGWIKDGRIAKTENHIRELAREHAIELVKNGSDAELEEYQHFISEYTTFNDIKYHIHFNVISAEVLDLLTKSERSKHNNLTEQQFKDHMNNLMLSKSALNEAIESAKDYNVHIDAKEYNKQSQEVLKDQKELLDKSPDTEVKEEIQSVSQEEIKEIQDAKQDQQQKVIESKKSVDEYLDARENGGYTAAKWKKHTYWLKRSDTDQYGDEIANCKYYGIALTFAENKFHSQLFQEFDNFHHISELNASMTNVPKLTNAGAKNPKERRLEYIIKVFLDASGFQNITTVIADIEFKTIIQVPHSNVKIEKPMQVGAYAHAGNIYLQRKIHYGGSSGGETDGFGGVKALYPYFDYNKFDIENRSIGQGDISVFSKIRKLLAHEMAHAIYGTTDNTQNHFEKMLQIDAKFDTTIANFKASSTLVTGSDIPKKSLTSIGAEKSDTIVATYTKGSQSELEKVTPPILIKEQKFSKKEIMYLTSESPPDHYYTYEFVLKEFGDTLKFTSIGYKVGDTVNIKHTSSNSYETKEISVEAKIIAPDDDIHRLRVKYDSHFISTITHTDILSKADPKKTFSDYEILYDSSAPYIRIWSQIKSMIKDGDADEEYYLKHYKPTGLKVGDKVNLNDVSGKIQSVSGGVMIFYGDNGDIESITHPEMFTKLQSTTPTGENGKMFDVYNKIKFFLQTYPLSTNKQIIGGITELASHNNPDKFLWNILNLYGKSEIEKTNDRPQRLKLKGV